MPLTKFPLDTDEPRIDVVLPVGTHKFKLTVVDDAGMRSQPDIIVIRVEARQPPGVTNVAPEAARQGKTVSAALYGRNLDAVTSVAAYLDSQQDERIQVTLQPGGTAERLPIRIRIMEHARPGLRTLEAAGPEGVATVNFTVLPETRPEPKNIVPASGRPGNTRPYAAMITGEDLRRAEAVTFLLRGRPDTQLRSAIRLASPEAVTLDVSISANAEFGGRQLQVTAPGAMGVSPAAVEFRVVPGPLQVVIVMFGLAAIVLHALLRLPPQLYIPVGVLYALLLAAMYLPLPGLSGARPWLRWVIIVVAIANVIGWILQASQPQPIRFAVPLVEIGLALLVFLESLQPQWKDRLPPAEAGAGAAATEMDAPVAGTTAAPVGAAAKAGATATGAVPPAGEAAAPGATAAVAAAPAVKAAPADAAATPEAAAPAVDAASAAEAVEAAAGAAAESVHTTAAPEADYAAHLEQTEAALNAADLTNLREKVEFIEGVGAAYAEKLNQAGIVTVKDLLQRGATRKGRAELVEATGLSAHLILTWINHADLFRIKGVGKQFGELLEAAGVDTVPELAQRNPANLFSKLTQVNAEKKLAGRSPRQDEVNSWVQQAKGLARVVEY